MHEEQPPPPQVQDPPQPAPAADSATDSHSYPARTTWAHDTRLQQKETPPPSGTVVPTTHKTQ